jgi:hypothetical protein
MSNNAIAALLWLSVLGAVGVYFYRRKRRSRARGEASPHLPSTSTDRLGFVIVASFWISLIAFGLWEDHTFNTMTPAQHLAAAKNVLENSDSDSKNEFSWDEGLRHARAVPTNSPEASEASEIAANLESRLEVVRQPRAAAQRAKIAWASAIRELQNQLRDLGYDIRVAKSNKADEIVIMSKDFSDTENRVKFLTFIRGRNSPAGNVCLLGFQTIRLESTIPFLGFSQPYSLDCFNIR